MNHPCLFWATGKWFILWVSSLKYSHQYVGLLSELETRTVCSCQLACKEVTSTQLADEWVEAEINKLFMDHLGCCEGCMKLAKLMFTVEKWHIRRVCWYSHDAGRWRSECREWKGQAASRSLSSSWRWSHHCVSGGWALWRPQLWEEKTQQGAV